MVGDNDAGAFAAHRQAGQDCGTHLLWTLFLLHALTPVTEFIGTPSPPATSAWSLPGMTALRGYLLVATVLVVVKIVTVAAAR